MKKVKAKKQLRSENTKKFLPVAIVFFVMLFLFVFFHSIGSSLMFSRKERVNVVIYGQTPLLLSVDLRNNINYAVSFYPDMEVQVPGGYGTYRIGAIGKLVSLEKKPELFSKAFTVGTSSFINYYFYPHTDAVYYGGDENKKIEFPTITDIFRMKSNASLFDRFYLAYKFSRENQKQYKELRSFTADFFVKEYQGYFYHKIYREEKKSVAIEYHSSYKTAETIGMLLEGVGIRVSDFQTTDESDKKCTVYEQTDEFSQTAEDIRSFFDCDLKKGKTGLYDIIFVLGTAEQSWAVK